MTRHSDAMGSHVLFAHNEYWLHLPTICTATPLLSIGRVTMFHISDALLRIESFNNLIETGILWRYMDRHYLHIGQVPNEDSQLVLDAYFTYCASEYESLIDMDRNLDNIENLVSILAERRDLTATCIVDFGCGVGLSASSALRRRLHIIGIERSREMRLRALSRGMEVHSPGWLAAKKSQSIDCCFASYVLHLPISAGSLRLLGRRLSPNGLFVANHHKARGIRFAEEVLSAEGFGSSEIQNARFSKSHGPYVLYTKT